MKLAIELRSVVHESVALLGIVIKRELGSASYAKIESIRQQMAELRESSDESSFKQLNQLSKELSKKSPGHRYEIAHAFTLMIEVMNVSENAYRSYRLTKRNKAPLTKYKPDSITYVLTAHPTEARSPQNIAIFQQIQDLLIKVLKNTEPGKKVTFDSSQKSDLLHLLEVAWRMSVVRKRSPKVKDEATALYGQVFRDEILFALMDANDRNIPFRLHSWIGGDKDGHPGVDEKVLMQSLTISRGQILKLVLRLLHEVRATLDLLSISHLEQLLSKNIAVLKSCRTLKAGDIKKVEIVRLQFFKLKSAYEKNFGELHPALRRIEQLFELFPALVIPMELREASDVIMAVPPKKGFPIDRMLQTIASLSKGSDPRFYARSFIISMCESALHMRTAALKQKAVFGEVRLPVVPLFEEASSLAESDQIMAQVFQDPLLKNAIHQFWESKVEMMVGYSDSSKEAGVLPSRLAIAEALPRLEKMCRKFHFTPVFFHGSGGSVDRGGGPIDNQTAWWPKSGVANYKATVQGEMVERWLASPMIAKRQLEKIALSSSAVLRKKFSALHDPSLDAFAEKITKAYRAKITAADFLQVVAGATPYSYMNYLKIGSRPAKRTQELTVKGLRAIPWILCWTQTRLLFPIWWGVGSAWTMSSPQEKKILQKAFHSEEVFASYVKALDFTLAKVEISVFKTYLSQSRLPAQLIETFSREVDEEFQKTLIFCKAMTGSKELLRSKRWLQESIQLRAPMIHPLNLLQIIAQKNREIDLLRLTVTGISSGMMSTG